MGEALGMLEVKGYVAAVTFTDLMLKAANVKLLKVKRTRGMGWMSIFIQGDVGAVNAAIAAAKAQAMAAELYVSSKVIPRPGKGIEELFESAAPPVVPVPEPVTPPASKPAPKPAPKRTRQPKTPPTPES
ncbi:BMC domain-containing protein [Lacticaseibacillus sp. GG6-2]